MNHLCSHFAKKVSATTDWADERSTKEQAIANSKRIETRYLSFMDTLLAIRPLDVAEETLDKIYEAYDIPDSLPGYPTLDERKVMAARSREEFNQVAKAYDAAWIALATGEYAAASHLLTTIIVDAEYESPEMHGLWRWLNSWMPSNHSTTPNCRSGLGPFKCKGTPILGREACRETKRSSCWMRCQAH